MTFLFLPHQSARRGQVVPEFMVLAILALLLFFSSFVFYVHEQDLIRVSDESREANRLAALLSDSLVSLSSLPAGSSLDFSHSIASHSFRVEISDHYLRILSGENTLVSKRLLADVQPINETWTGSVLLLKTTEGVELDFS